MPKRLAAVVAVVWLTGCGEGGSDVALPTDGPNQVVVKVPGMT
jgi:hypothetical protein